MARPRGAHERVAIAITYTIESLRPRGRVAALVRSVVRARSRSSDARSITGRRVRSRAVECGERRRTVDAMSTRGRGISDLCA